MAYYLTLFQAVFICLLCGFVGAAPRGETMGAVPARNMVEYVIATHKVAIFSKSYCPNYPAVRDTLAKYKFRNPQCTPYVKDIDDSDNMFAIQNYLQDRTGARTVPRVFIGGRAVGGREDIDIEHKSGQLREMLRQAGCVY